MSSGQAPGSSGEPEQSWRPGQVVEVAGEGERYILRHPCTCCGKACPATAVDSAAAVCLPLLSDAGITKDHGG